MAFQTDYQHGDSADVGVVAGPMPIELADKTERTRRIIGWVIRAAMGLAIVVLVAASLALGLPQSAGGSSLPLAAAILGVSIAFTGVLVPCVVVLLSRRSAAAGLIRQVEEIESQVNRGLAQGATIRRRERRSPATLG